MYRCLVALKKIVYSACLVFTCTVFLLLALNAYVNGDNVNTTYLITPDKYLPIFLLSLAIGTADRFLCFRPLPLGLRLPVHFLVCLGGIYVVFIRHFGMGTSGRGRFMVMLLLAVIYAIYVAAAYAVRRLIRSTHAVCRGLKEEKAAEQNTVG